MTILSDRECFFGDITMFSCLAGKTSFYLIMLNLSRPRFCGAKLCKTHYVQYSPTLGWSLQLYSVLLQSFTTARNSVHSLNVSRVINGSLSVLCFLGFWRVFSFRRCCNSELEIFFLKMFAGGHGRMFLGRWNVSIGVKRSAHVPAQRRSYGNFGFKGWVIRFLPFTLEFWCFYESKYLKLQCWWLHDRYKQRGCKIIESFDCTVQITRNIVENLRMYLQICSLKRNSRFPIIKANLKYDQAKKMQLPRKPDSMDSNGEFAQSKKLHHC